MALLHDSDVGRYVKHPILPACTPFLCTALQPFPLAYPRAYRELQSGRVMSANSSTPTLASPSPRGGIPRFDSCPAGVLPTPAPPSPTPLKLVPENT